MNIDIIFYKTDRSLNEAIINFTNSFSKHTINLKFTYSFEELNSVYDEKKNNIILFNTSFDYENVVGFLYSTPKVLSKIIILSKDKEQIFDLIKYNIFDFLTLPASISDILSSLNKCINLINDEFNLHQLKIAETKFYKFIPVNSIKKIELIKIEDIICFEADGRYTLIYLNNGISKMASKNLGEFQKLLDPDVFCRIHHKFIINLNNLVNIIKSDGYYCEMKNNKNIPVSKRKLEDLNLALNIGKHLF